MKKLTPSQGCSLHAEPQTVHCRPARHGIWAEDLVPSRVAGKKLRGVDATYEMTWAPDGRALFAYGQKQNPGKYYIVWLDIGSHDILP